VSGDRLAPQLVSGSSDLGIPDPFEIDEVALDLEIALTAKPAQGRVSSAVLERASFFASFGGFFFHHWMVSVIGVE
jgi:hypothetical protein